MSRCNKSRREFIASAGLIAGGALLPSLSLANPGIGGARINELMAQAPPLYTTVGTIAGEFKIVRSFFSFNCNFSREYHQRVFNWGLTLPKDVRFLPTPVVALGDDASMPAALAFYGFWLEAPTRLNEFMNRVYNTVGQGRKDPANIWSYIEVGMDMGLKMETAVNAIKNGEAKKWTLEASYIAGRYGLKVTPSIGIGGRYLINPDGVAGKEDLMLKLLNAMTSKMIIGD